MGIIGAGDISGFFELRRSNPIPGTVGAASLDELLVRATGIGSPQDPEEGLDEWIREQARQARLDPGYFGNLMSMDSQPLKDHDTNEPIRGSSLDGTTSFIVRFYRYRARQITEEVADARQIFLDLLSGRNLVSGLYEMILMTRGASGAVGREHIAWILPDGRITNPLAGDSHSALNRPAPHNPAPVGQVHTHPNTVGVIQTPSFPQDMRRNFPQLVLESTCGRLWLALWSNKVLLLGRVVQAGFIPLSAESPAYEHFFEVSS